MKITDLVESLEGATDALFLKKFPEPLYHGSRSISPGRYTFKMREKSRDTFAPIHRTISDLSKKKLGIDIRALLFVSLSTTEAAYYGTVYEFVALGSDYRIFVADGVCDLTKEFFLGSGTIGDNIIEVVRNGLYEYLVPPIYTDAIEKLIRNEIDNTTAEDLNEVNDAIYEIVSRTLPASDETVKDFIDNGFDILKKEISKNHSALTQKLEEYINMITEVKHYSEIQNHKSELMIYAPDKIMVSR